MTSLSAISLGAGRFAVAVSNGWKHMCAILDDGRLKWYARGTRGREAGRGRSEGGRAGRQGGER
eukprot:3939505-Rhodomonas_salina.2